MSAAVPFTILGLDHVVLRVRDVAALERFYGEVIGCSLERRQPALGLVQLRAGRALIDLVDVAGKIGREGGDPPGREGRNMEHFCLRIDPFDEAALRNHFNNHGINLGKLHENYGADGTGPSFYFKDPEGNTIEIKGPPTAPA